MSYEINWDEVNDSIPEFNFINDIKIAKVLSINDINEIKVAFPVYKKMYKWNCILLGIDYSKFKTSDLDFIKQNLSDKILNKMVMLYCDKFDGNKNLLVTVKLLEQNINKWLTLL
jgi:hypothetical protein